MLDSRGGLIWMEDKFGQAMNFNIQKYKGLDYMTFWTGVDNGPHANGSYMLVGLRLVLWQE
jgi:hypothetical protein